MQELIDRLEMATGPERELDAEIDVAVRGGPGTNFPAWVYTNFPTWRARADGRVEVVHQDGTGGVHWTPRPYTASIDAALMLAPSNMQRLVRDGIPGGDGTGNDRPYANLGLGFDGRGDTMALALCAAALRAWASEHPSHSRGTP